MISEKIVAALTKLGLHDVVIGMEATSVYGDNLVYALREDGRLGQFHRKIHVLNPKQVKNFKKSYPELPKNDTVDAFVIADQLRFGRIGKEVYMDDCRYKALQTLTRARFFAVQSLTREKERFANYLFLKCSGIAPRWCFFIGLIMAAMVAAAVVAALLVVVHLVLQNGAGVAVDSVLIL